MVQKSHILVSICDCQLLRTCKLRSKAHTLNLRLAMNAVKFEIITDLIQVLRTLFGGYLNITCFNFKTFASSENWSQLNLICFKLSVNLFYFPFPAEWLSLVLRCPPVTKLYFRIFGFKLYFQAIHGQCWKPALLLDYPWLSAWRVRHSLHIYRRTD